MPPPIPASYALADGTRAKPNIAAARFGDSTAQDRDAPASVAAALLEESQR
jgi:hypothetical protein